MLGQMRILVQSLCLTMSGLASLRAEPERVFTAEDRSWWAVQPVTDAAVPADGEGWARNKMDRFVARSLHAAKLEPAPEADRNELVQRACFDLHGLPPTPEQVAAFVNDARPDAWERLIDDLLESPRYGERWGQHWLDVVRFAESDGYRQDAFRPDAWPYRDWVIKSFNDDKPYDRFVCEQLAGDEIDPENPEVLIGTAFLRNGLYEYNQRDVRFHWELILNELTNVTAEAFLGLGIGCAQCHDHKFDPILQKDYYRLQAFLAPVRWRHDMVLGTAQERAAYETKLGIWEETTAEIRRAIDDILEPGIQDVMDGSFIKFPEDIQALFKKREEERTPYEQQLMELARIQLDYERERFNEKGIKGEPKMLLDYLRAELAQYDHLKPEPLPRAFVATDVRREAPQVPLGGRSGEGDVRPGILSLLDPADMEIVPGAGPRSTGRRLALARWITGERNPLTSRVFVNRLWQHHFGRGIVATPNDFGNLGAEPSHPELLDWLAARFLEGNRRMKPIHRLIMSSAAYRQTARREPGERARTVDPENRLLWRFPPRRLDAEQARDAMLAASGELNLTTGGPSVDGDTPRRSVYVKKIRNTPDELLKGFDAPVGFESTAQRSATTTATQALRLVNGEWTMKRASAFARRLAGSRPEVGADELRVAYRLAFGREASLAEVEEALEFIASQRARIEKARKEPPAPAPAVRPLSDQFARVQGIELGDHELQLQPGGPFQQLHLRETVLARDEFTIEAVVVLDSLYPGSEVRVLASRWNGEKTVGGWTFGVTSTKSDNQPRNLIMQLAGKDFQGNPVYEVVPSGLRVPLNKAVYLAAAISTTPTAENQTGGEVTFYLRDLSAPEAKLAVRKVRHPIVQGLQDPGVRLILGGRDQPGRHLWDGEVARFAITNGTVSQEELLVGADSEARERLLDWRFSGATVEENLPGTEWLRPEPKPPADPRSDLMGALTDFCHALLTSNEFLYLH